MSDWTNAPYTPQQPAPKPKKSKKWIAHVILYPVVFFIAIAIGSAGGSTDTTTSTAATKPAPTKTVTVPAKPQATATVTVSEQPVAPETTEPAAGDSFEGDGTFEVGTDIKPGTYKSTGDDELCYWARLKNTSGDFDAIITNHNGANATVTIKKTDGAFETARCGTWTKVK